MVASTPLYQYGLSPDPLREEMRRMFERARVPLRRTMREFAEQDIIIPTGPYQGRRFKVERQPFTGLLFDAIENSPSQVNRFFGTGPTQTGKTMALWVIPMMYHLFEIEERVVGGVPLMDMARDKWRDDLLPAIEASKYRELLPRSGAASRGGKSNLTRIDFLNGAALRFMSEGGSDKSVAGFTARVIIFTEVDGFEGRTDSPETDRLQQIEARSRAFGSNKVTYGECTLSTTLGRTHQEITGGYEGEDDAPYHMQTLSRIVLPCHACGEWVTPEREHFLGYENQPSISLARQNAAFHCPSCGEKWTEDQRIDANHNARLIYRGQKIDKDGTVTGSIPDTDTLGFRWSAVNNCLPNSVDQVVADELAKIRAEDEENEERKLCQFVWALPHKPTKLEIAPLKYETLIKRQRGYARGMIPWNTEALTMGVDLGMYLCHWLLIAWLPDGSPHIVDYGLIEVPSRELGVEAGLLTALREFRDTVVANGWVVEPTPAGRESEAAKYAYTPGTAEGTRQPDLIMVDAGYQGGKDGTAHHVVYRFINECNAGLTPQQSRWWCSVGRGAGQMYGTGYRQPVRESTNVQHVGDHYFLSEQQAEYSRGIILTIFDADHWKAFVHSRLTVRITDDNGALLDPMPAGAWTFFSAPPSTHTKIVKHLLNEKQVIEFKAGVGEVVYWHRTGANHYLDCSTMASVGAHMLGVRIIEDERIIPATPQDVEVIVSESVKRDGQNYLANQRD